MGPLNVVWFTVVFVSIYLKWTLSIRLVPERTEITYVNEKYVYNATAYVVRYGRKSIYYYNLEAGIKHTWGNNITNTQYKRSFVEFHLNLCDMLQKDQYFGKMFAIVMARYGAACPFSPGVYRFLNVSLPADKLPNILPFQRGKLELTFNQLPSRDIVSSLYTTFSVKLS